jgi:SAM-dependent methyltransferase
VEIDWGDGDYARIAATLMPAAEVLLDAVGVAAGEALADVGCGTGNVALAAAARGAVATGVDTSARLLELARARAAGEGAEARFVLGDAGALPLPDAGFDVAASAFGVIFAPDPARALAEMVRVVRPEGRVALTSWTSSGAIFEAGRALRQALPQDDPPSPPPRWDDAGWIADRLADAGARDVRATTAEIAFAAESPAAWMAGEEEHHPAWRAARRALGARRWEEVARRMLAALEDGNEDPSAFRATSGYLVVVARR